MKKTYLLQIEGKHPDRLLEAIKHEIRKYIKRERNKTLPKGSDYWHFDCKFGLSADSAEVVNFDSINTRINACAADKAPAFYLELLARPALRGPRQPRAAAPDLDADESVSD